MGDAQQTVALLPAGPALLHRLLRGFFRGFRLLGRGLRGFLRSVLVGKGGVQLVPLAEGVPEFFILGGLAGHAAFCLRVPAVLRGIRGDKACILHALVGAKFLAQVLRGKNFIQPGVFLRGEIIFMFLIHKGYLLFSG